MIPSAWRGLSSPRSLELQAEGGLESPPHAKGGGAP